MVSAENHKNIPLSQTLAVLIGFPILATLISLLLIHRSLITNLGLDFFNTFWLIVTAWYILQIFIIGKIIRKAGWSWSDIGLPYSKKKITYLIIGYLLFAISLIIFIEMALANSEVDPAKFASISGLTPKTTTARIIFIIMGLFTGLAEEIVYRGFAIRALERHGIHTWLAVVIAAIPFIFQHGLKSLDQFAWFLTWGLVFGILFVWLKKLGLIIIIHWLVILSAMVAILQVLS